MLGFVEVLIWGADHYRARLPEGGRFLAWDKLGGHASWDTFADVEFAWHSHKAASRICTWRWKGCFLREPEDRGKPNPHPTTKPEGLMRWCIEQLKTDPPAIADPYMGSGTTGVACAQLGRPFIGIEIERRYFDIACARIEAAQSQLAAAA